MDTLPNAATGGNRLPLQFTCFPRNDAVVGQRSTLQWVDLCQWLLANAPQAAMKDALPLIKLATFAGDRRADATMEAVYGIEGDYDGEVVQPEVARDILARAGVEAFIYTSRRHRPDKPRWRVLCPLSQSVEPADRHGYVAQLNGVLGGILAPESFTPSQSYYFGKEAGGEPIQSWHVAGQAIDAVPGLQSVGPARRLDAPRIKPGEGRRARDYSLALDTLRSRDPGDMERGEWLIFSGAFCAAVFGLVDPAHALADWQSWNTAHGPTNDPAANARSWAGFAKDGTNGDFNSLADLGTDHQAKAWRWFEGTARQTPNRSSQFTSLPSNFFIRASDMVYRKPEYHIDGLIETDALVVIFGDPAAGKSFVAIDMASCVATGEDFHEHEVKQGSVFYIAGEGKNGLRRRMTAWEQHNERSLDGAPLYVSLTPAQFLDDRFIETITKAITGLVSAHGNPRLIIVDTLARNFGPGDENSATDMNRFIAAMDQIRTPFAGCTVIIVHHSGHGEKDRARGSSALRAAVDAEYKVTKTNENNIKVKNLKMKDASPPDDMQFHLDSVGYSAALTFMGKPTQTASKLTHDAELALETLRECPGEVVHMDVWRAAFYEKREGKDDAKKKGFQRGREHLVKNGHVLADDAHNYRCAPMPIMER